jgi:spore cortex biosynthesis protein YabQ
MESQAVLFLISVAVGAFGAFFFDIFRILRKIVKHVNFAVQIEDILFWLVLSFVMFYVIYMQNNGEIRFYLILGFSLGMILYLQTVSRVVLAAADAIVSFCKKLFSLILRIILLPFQVILHFLKVPAAFLLKKAKKCAGLVKKKLQKLKGYAKIKGRKAFINLRIVFRKR